MMDDYTRKMAAFHAIFGPHAQTYVWTPIRGSRAETLKATPEYRVFRMAWAEAHKPTVEITEPRLLPEGE